jgi:hypothetical protein
MGDAYTPGLTVTEEVVVRKTRRLPLEGRVLVERGARVRADQVVARTELPGKVHITNFANVLGVIPQELSQTLLVKPGESIEKGELLAEHRSFFGLFRSEVRAPTDGTFDSLSEVTGQGILREPPAPVDVKAYIDGTIIEVIEGEGVVVETRAALVQGIFGLAGEVHAPLAVVAESPGDVLDAEAVTAALAGKIVVGGARATLGAVRRAQELGVAGIVVGGFAYQDVRELLGYDVGVAITGTEDLGTTLIVTEGFGAIAMARATFELLRRHDGQQASLSGATQIRAGVIRPEVVIPHRGSDDAGAPAPEARGLDVGAPVRCIRAPYFGRIGEVVELPVELQEMPSETRVRVVVVELDGDRVVLPRANVEVIER